MRDFKIINDDNINVLRKMKEKSVDMIFVDPPYNMQLSQKLIRYDGSVYDGIDEDWDKFSSIQSYKEFSKKWLKESLRVLKDDGTMWIIGSFQNIYLIGNLIQEMDLWLINDIIWEKSNPTPNFLGNKFCNSHEILLWFKKNKNSKFTFNYHTMKYLNGGKQEKSVWKIPICSGKERLKDENGNKLHKTQKPIRLLDKIILSSTKKGDTILDIFSGTATTGASAIKFKRKYIGIEMDKKYIQPSIDRINNIEVSTNKILIDNLLDIKPPQVRVEKLLEKNYISPNEKLYNKEKGIVVQIDKDGKIHINNKKYSIHQAAGHFLNKKRSNGWDYWYVIRNNQLVSIREIRSKYREKELNFKEFNLKEYIKEKRKD